jgi:hypothetical protein
MEFPHIAENVGLIVRLREIIDQEVKKSGYGHDFFKDIFVKQKLEEYDKLITRNYSELISDLFGCALFGHTYVVAVYLYLTMSMNLDESNWDKGYLSWRFRLQNCCNFISYSLQKKPELEIDLALYNMIDKIIRGPVKDSLENDFCSIMIDVFRTKQDEIFDSVMEYAKTESFLEKVSVKEIDAAMQRLGENIIPNAMNIGGLDYPIDIRNILYSIWIFCYDKDSKDLKEYADKIQFYNLLGVKGIELSVEQGNYNDFVTR